MNEMPNWEGFMIPLLKVLSDGQTRHRREALPLVTALARLSEAQKSERLDSGELKYANRAGWALSHLTNIGALIRPQRGYYQITEGGLQLINLFPDGATQKELEKLAEDPVSPIRPYQRGERRKQPDQVSTVDGSAEASTLTPIEQVQTGLERIREEVAADLLTRLQGKEPGFFEQAVIDLLLAMGYGGTTGKGSTTQLTNDGGIDGVIDQDILGLNRVYVQAKRFSTGNTVGRPDVQAFVGALSGKADRGVFITTSSFSPGAREYAENVPTRIILIDGDRLTKLMIRFGVGVQVRETYKVVEIDEDFFA